MKVTVVIPTYNERANLPLVVRAVREQGDYRLVVVDDQSPDGTGEVAEALARQHAGGVMVVHRTGPRGLGRSYLDGFRRALETDAELICQMDADLSHDPKYLPDLVAAAADADLVIGSRYLYGISVVNWPLHRIALSAFANGYVRTVTRLRVRDCTSGFRCWRREALQALPLDRLVSDGYAFLVETLYEAACRGGRIAEVPIIFVERRQGHSKVSKRVLMESLIVPWQLIWRHRADAALHRPR